MTQRRLVQALLTLFVLSSLGLSAQAAKKKRASGPELPPTQQTISCVGFGAKGKEAVFRVLDENIGTLFQVRNIKRNAVVASYPFRKGGEKRAWRKVKRAHKVSDDFSDSPENLKKRVVMMSQVKGDKILIHMMRGEVIKPYTQIPLVKNRKGEPAEAFVKQMVWDAKGKTAIVVYHQKTKGRMRWEGDFVHAFKFKSYRSGFGGGS